MDKLLDFQPVNLGLIHASMHVSRWWNQEGRPPEILQCTRKVSVYMWPCLDFVMRECIMLKPLLECDCLSHLV